MQDQLTIVGLTGAAGSGKSTIAVALQAKGLFTRMSFGHGLKRVAGFIFGFSYEQLYGEEREVTDERYGFSPRYVLQYLGTEVFRMMYANVWIDVLKRTADEMGVKRIVIDDLRFENEADFVHSLGGIVILIDTPPMASNLTDDRQTHVSEAGVKQYDYLVTNDHKTSIEGVIADVIDIVSEHHDGKL